jgi:3-demethoxyubiquinol 3-hydroxylase
MKYMLKTSLHYSLLDRFLIAADNATRALFTKPIALRQNPARDIEEAPLTATERKQSAAYMRINHTGEICAQALYYGQAITAKSLETQRALLTSAAEEMDHLAWCQDRIDELNARPSYFNLFWYLVSFKIGILAGIASDSQNLGFVVETERQVEQHLKHHLTMLSPDDVKSQVILQQMCEDEAQHATTAINAGATELPDFVKKLMRAMSKVMTTITYYI